VQNPTTSLGDGVAETKLLLDAADRPAILVGHSYGGVVITEAGNHPRVVGLVYIAASVPSEGESVDALIKNPPPGAPVPPILAPQNGRLFLDREKFHAAFAADLDPEEAAFMADCDDDRGEGLPCDLRVSTKGGRGTHRQGRRRRECRVRGSGATGQAGQPAR
jgi:pimeloyl-ACP methyl ester carboxylesterase